MRLILFFILCTTSTVWATSQNTTESDAFHNSAFGSPDIVTPEIQRQEEQLPEAPLWVTPDETELPERQEEMNIPKNRVNEWQEQSKRASEEDL